MVSGQQDLRHRSERVFDGPREVRAVQQAVLEAVLGGRFGVIERPVLQARDRIDQYRGRQLAAREHVVPDRDFLIDLGADQPLVDAFVAATKEDESWLEARRRTPAWSSRRPWGLR